MKIKKLYRMYLPLLIMFLVFFSQPVPAQDEVSQSPEAIKKMSTGIENQVSVALTVYNANLGLVKDVRELNIDSGRGNFRFMDVASQIMPASVLIRSLTSPESLTILEQNYEYDLLNPQKLLDKYVGRKVKLFSKNTYTDKEDVVEATLLSNNDGPVYQIGDEITFNYPGRIIFPNVPDDLISKPTLVWMFDNKLASRQKVEVSYLTTGISWHADYVIKLNESDEMADLSAWVTIENMSGAAYNDAKLKLVAGDINRVRDEREYRDTMMYAAKTALAEESFKEDEFFEYHIYTLQRGVTIKENQTKQISLIKADGIPVKKEFLYRGNPYYYRGRISGESEKEKAGVYIEMENKKDNNLGIPLPKGTVRVYKNDKEGGMEFIGEDSIDHTPKNEKVRIKVGDAFDIAVNRKQTAWEKIAHNTYEAEFELSFRNHKKEDVAVRVIEPVQGDWKMITSTHDYKKTEASVAEFIIPVPKDNEAILRYRVRMVF